MDTSCCFEELPWLKVQEDCTAGVLIYCLNGLNQSFLYAEVSEDLPQACMPDSEWCPKKREKKSQRFFPPFKLRYMSVISLEYVQSSQKVIYSPVSISYLSTVGNKGKQTSRFFLSIVCDEAKTDQQVSPVHCL